MPRSPKESQYLLPLFMLFITLLIPVNVSAASCKTQSQMTPAQRDALSSAARTLIGNVQSGDLRTLRANTTTTVATDFAGISDTTRSLMPLMQNATITIDSLFALDASSETAGTPRTDFYCGTPVIALNFTNLPSATYAVAILHATGVPQPQQISLILSESAGHGWTLVGISSKPMIEAGHDGLWYWMLARQYAQKNMNWNAWFYYRTAAFLLAPAAFLSSPNLEKLQHEEASVRPNDLPDTVPMNLDVHGSIVQVTSIDTTTALGALDVEIHYTPTTEQEVQLNDSPTARKQITEIMTALLALRPELREAFHGVWIRADKGDATIYSLELPMSQFVPFDSQRSTVVSPALP